MLNPARLLACVILFSPAAWAALPFAVAPVQYQMTDSGYSTEATVEAVKQSTVAAQVSGRVAAVNFDAGDYVKAGSVFLRLSAQELSSAGAGSQTQVAQAAPPPASAVPGTVIYRITGTKGLLDLVTVIYTDAQGALQTDVNVALPWSKTITLDPGVTLSSVTGTSVTGQLNCEVLDANGAVIAAQNGNSIITNCTR